MDHADDALRALEIAKNKLASGDVAGAERFAKKSIGIRKTAAAESFLSNLASGSSASAHASNVRQRHAPTQPEASTSKPKPQETAKRDFTPEQVAMVKRIRACRHSAYYEILAVDKSCSDVEIKKAYRKHSLSVHPDKNGAPGADEAFKMVSTAFQVLSDGDKRAHYDRYGSDPGERPSAPSPFMRRQAQPGFGGEVSPEELFNMFFGGGGMAGGSFNGFAGGPGMRTYTFGGPPRRTQHQRQGQNQQQQTSSWIQILPLLLLLAFTLLSNIPSLFSASPPPDPTYSYEPTAVHRLHRQTHNLKVDYYLNPNEFRHTHLYNDLEASNPSQIASLWTKLQAQPEWSDVSIPDSLTTFEARVENHLLSALRVRCENEGDIQQRKIQRAQGFLGLVGRDNEEVERLQKEVLPACDRLRKLGFGRRTQRPY